jgi:phosphoribosyl 1,2-cyclic phosphodiesterase
MIPLYSGSSGNSVFVQFEDTRILVDVGCTTKSIVTALEQVGQNPETIDAVLITHDHSDHMKGLDVFVRKYDVPVYATHLTWRGLRAAQKKPHAEELDHTITSGESFYIGDVEVVPFSTPHDAKGSCGFRFFYKERSMAVATDLGYFSDEVKEAIVGSEVVLIEANYDRDMLWNGEYPWYLKKRIDGEAGHLCNIDCAEAVCYLYHNGTKHFVLGHLSKENNMPMIAEKEVVRAMDSQSAIRGETYFLSVANRYYPTEPVILYAFPQENDELTRCLASETSASYGELSAEFFAAADRV